MEGRTELIYCSTLLGGMDRELGGRGFELSQGISRGLFFGLVRLQCTVEPHLFVFIRNCN